MHEISGWELNVGMRTLKKRIERELQTTDLQFFRFCDDLFIHTPTSLYWWDSKNETLVVMPTIPLVPT